MANDLRTTVILDLKGNLERNARRNSRAIKDMTRSGNHSLRNLNSGFKRHGSTVTGLIGRYKSLAGVAAIAAAGIAANKVISVDARLTQFGINADIDDSELENVKRKIFSTANLPHIRVKPDEIFSGLEEIQKQTGQKDFAINNLENIGLLISATGAAGRDVGATLSNLFNQLDIKKADAITRSLDLLAIGGKKGAFELADFATQFNTVGAAFASTGSKGEKAVGELNAIMQMVRRTSSTSDSAATNFERLISAITSEKVQELRDSGIKLFKNEETKEFLPQPDIIKQIITVTGGDEEKLGRVFDIRALKALRAFGLQYKAGKGFKLFDELLAIKGTGETLRADSLRNAKTAESVKTSISNNFGEFFDDIFSDGTKALAESFDKVDKGESNILQEAYNLQAKFGGVLAETLGLSGPFTEEKKHRGDTKVLDAFKLEVKPGGATPKTSDSGRAPTEVQKSSVDIHIISDTPVRVKNLKSSSKNHLLNVDTGHVMVSQ